MFTVTYTLNDSQVVTTDAESLFELGRLIYSIDNGHDESFTAYPAEGPWVDFRTGDVARIEVTR